MMRTFYDALYVVDKGKMVMQMLPAAEGEVEVLHIQGKHTKQYDVQDEPRAFIFSHDILRRN